LNNEEKGDLNHLCVEARRIEEAMGPHVKTNPPW